ncbi:MAG: fructose 1,6-bisphosphatase, partial [Minisyncoccales bacterium]
EKILEKVREKIQENKGEFIDSFIFHAGDDIAILLTHEKGPANEKIHQICFNAFLEASKIAKEQGLYGAGQDLLVSAFSGNVKGMGPQVAEMEIEEREAEPFLVFLADKTEPGAFNLPLYLSFCDPMHNSGLLLSKKIKEGFRFVVMDVSFTEGDRVIELKTPEEIYDLAVLLREPSRFVVEAIYPKKGEEKVAVVSTTRLHNIAGKYVGKDDPVMVVRVQKEFPATGEILSPFALGYFVSGFMRGSHQGPLMPVKKGTTASFFDGPPLVSCLAFCLKEGKLTEPVDCFDHPFWDEVRMQVAQKAKEIRKQGFYGTAMLPMDELEYTGIVETLNELEKKFKIRK